MSTSRLLRNRIVIVASALVLGAGFTASGGSAVWAQSSAVPNVAPRNPSDVAPAEKPAAPMRDSAACASPNRALGPQAQTPDVTGQAPSSNLSDKLAQNNGVICPPSGVDSDIRAPSPDTGNTPIIRPPGSPGGDPTIQPK